MKVNGIIAPSLGEGRQAGLRATLEGVKLKAGPGRQGDAGRDVCAGYAGRDEEVNFKLSPIPVG